MTERALVIGAGGLVGKAVLGELLGRGHEAVGTGHVSAQQHRLRALDIGDLAALHSVNDELQPTVILLPAAWTDVDGCERDPKRAHAINVEGARHVAEAARAAGASLVYYSTDYVFDGRTGPYTEDDEPGPVNVYGETKLAAERLIQEQLPSDHLIIRTTGVFGWDPDSLNFAMQVWRRLSAHEAMTAPSDQFSTPTLASHLAEITVRLIEAGHRGVINVAGADLLSRSEFGRRLAGGFGLDGALIRDCTTAEQGRLAQRPMRGGLITARLEAITGSGALSVDEALVRLGADQHRNPDPIGGPVASPTLAP